MIYLIGFPIGVIITLYCALYHKNLIRVDWNKVSSFLGFMVLVTFFRIGMFDLVSRIDPSMLPALPPELLATPTIKFMLVFWEDAFFGISIYYIMNRFKDKAKLKYLMILAISLIFGYGHVYQGAAAVMITAIYPYFISYKFGIKNGFGTVMVSHILYDFITFYTVYLMPFFI